MFFHRFWGAHLSSGCIPSCVCHPFLFWEDLSVVESPPVSFLNLCLSILLCSSSTGFLKTGFFFEGWERGCWVVSSLSCNWCLCVTVKVFFNYSVICDCVCVSGPVRGPGDVSENVLSSAGRVAAGCEAGRGESMESSSRDTSTPPGWGQLLEVPPWFSGPKYAPWAYCSYEQCVCVCVFVTTWPGCSSSSDGGQNLVIHTGSHYLLPLVRIPWSHPHHCPRCICFRVMIWFLLNFVFWGGLIITGPRGCLSLLAFSFLIYLFKTFFMSFLMIRQGKGRMEHISLLDPILRWFFFSKSFEVFLWPKNSVLIIRGGNGLIFASQYLNRC